MAKVPMARMEVIAMITDSKSVIERLQRRGVVDLIRRDDGEADAAGTERMSTVRSVTIFEQNKNNVQQALFILDEYAPVKSSMLNSFRPRRELSTSEFGEYAAAVENTIRTAHDISALYQNIAEKNNAIKNRRQAIASLEYWRPLGHSMRFTGTASTSAFIGTLPGEWTGQAVLDLLNGEAATDDAAAPADPLPAEAQIIYTSKERTGVFVLTHKECADICEQALRNKGFAAPPLLSREAPAETIGRYEREIAEWEEIVAADADAIREKADVREDLKFAVDYLSMRQDKYRALEELSLTQSTVIIEGYIPKTRAAALNNELEARYPNIYVGLFEPEEDEDVPVALKNVMPAYALEDITADYSMPGRHDIDPNPVMMFFYYLFFGLMFSEGGYGLIMVIATTIILLVLKPEGNMKRNMQKFFLCGLSTVFWGAIFGSWFGDAVEVISRMIVGRDNQISIPALTNYLPFDLNEPLTLLIFSLVLGFIHIMVGMAVKFYSLCRQGKVLDALFDVGLWWVIFGGFVVVIMSMVVTTEVNLMSIGLYIALAGAIGLVLTQGRGAPSIPGKIIGGVASLYDITAYFSDILSYCRLMALALVTGRIAQVFNMLGEMVGGAPVIGVVLFALLFVAGHAINFGINVLGAYVHGNRLQYVEFFNKFYEGGGRPFSPFAVNTKHFKFKEDNINV